MGCGGGGGGRFTFHGINASGSGFRASKTCLVAECICLVVSALMKGRREFK